MLVVLVTGSGEGEAVELSQVPARAGLALQGETAFG